MPNYSKTALKIAAVLFVNLLVFAGALYAQWQWLTSEQLDQVAIRLRTVAEERSKQIDSWRVGIERLTSSAVSTPTIGLFLADISDAVPINGVTAPLTIPTAFRDQADFTARLLTDFNEAAGAISSALYLKDGRNVVGAGVTDGVVAEPAPEAIQAAANGQKTFAPINSTDKELYLSLYLPVPSAQYFGQSRPGQANLTLESLPAEQVIGVIRISFAVTEAMRRFVEPMPLAGRKDEIRIFHVMPNSQTEYLYKSSSRSRLLNMARKLELNIFDGANTSLEFAKRQLGDSMRLVYYAGFKNQGLNWWIVTEINGKDIEDQVGDLLQNSALFSGISFVFFMISLLLIWRLKRT